MPAAFLGYKLTEEGLTIRCCAWCADRKELERWAKAKGTRVTHGICPIHHAEQVSRRLAEAP